MGYSESAFSSAAIADLTSASTSCHKSDFKYSSLYSLRVNLICLGFLFIVDVFPVSFSIRGVFLFCLFGKELGCFSASLLVLFLDAFLRVFSAVFCPYFNY
jgi:hypothetical protein